MGHDRNAQGLSWKIQIPLGMYWYLGPGVLEVLLLAWLRLVISRASFRTVSANLRASWASSQQGGLRGIRPLMAQDSKGQCPAWKAEVVLDFLKLP